MVLGYRSNFTGSDSIEIGSAVTDPWRLDCGMHYKESAD